MKDIQHFLNKIFSVYLQFFVWNVNCCIKIFFYFGHIDVIVVNKLAIHINLSGVRLTTYDQAPHNYFAIVRCKILKHVHDINGKLLVSDSLPKCSTVLAKGSVDGRFKFFDIFHPLAYGKTKILKFAFQVKLS